MFSKIENWEIGYIYLLFEIDVNILYFLLK